MDLLDLFDRGSQWTATKIPAAVTQLDGATPCDEWDVRTLLNHMVDGLRYFSATARGEEAQLDTSSPQDLIGDDPGGTYDQMRQETLRAFAEPGAIEKTGPLLGIAFCDQLLHGCDLARATGQDATMPDDLAGAALAMLDGRLTPDRRGAAFKPSVDIAPDASAQEKLLGYTGRQP